MHYNIIIVTRSMTRIALQRFSTKSNDSAVPLEKMW